MSGSPQPRVGRWLVLLAAAGTLVPAVPVLAADEGDGAALPGVVVIGNVPLPGLGLPAEQVPANVQSATGADLDRAQSLDLSDFMNQSLGGVHLNGITGNPYQADVNYRGYTASPLLGTPQGLSVFMDGVRMNQPFGDVVSWDLIPRMALDSITLMPGSNPVFGLNTLGGALSLQTKDGRRFQGSALQLSGGSFGRLQAEFEHGGRNDRGLHWYVAGSAFREDGWRVASPSRVGQLFGKVGWANAATEVSLTGLIANTALTGNGLQEQRQLAQSRSSVYTVPDETDNRSIFLNLALQHAVGEQGLFAGNIYYRRIRTRTLNGDLNDDALTQSLYTLSDEEQEALTAAGYTGFPTAGASAANTPYPFWRCIANVLLEDEPAEKCNGLLNRSATRQSQYGFNGQYTLLGDLAGRPNQLTVGLGFDANRIDFQQSSQFGYINPDRSVTPVNAFADGTYVSDDDGVIDNRVDLNGRTRTWSLYATDTWSVTDALFVTASGRYNHTSVVNRDRLNPGGGGGSLDGDHTFSRFNPAIGLAFVPGPSLSFYAGYNEGSRTPTTMELGCADPANPCKLPNAMAGDPPLAQVVTRTWEAGVRGRIGAGTRWNAGLFRSTNVDDILFVANDAAGFGYFRNFGRTRRQGLELGLDSNVGPVTLNLHYTWLDATYQSPETLGGGSNSSSDAESPGLDGNINVKPGDRIPLIPQHIFKARANWRIDAAWSVGLGMTAIGGSWARGNENNQHQPDGQYYLGSGRAAGYAVFELSGRYRATPQLSFFARIDNLFNRRFNTAAQLGATGFGANGAFLARPFAAVDGEYPLTHATFFAPGAPRSVVVGMRYQFDRPSSAP